MKPEISVIIPVKNGAQTIDTCLRAIYEQTVIDKTEVIIIDSGSVDETLDIVKQYPVRLYQIPPEEFGHGKTRNYGVTLAQGEFVLMTVQDARAASNNWLEAMLSHFKDEQVSAVCGQQAVPHENDKNPLQWHRPVSVPGFNEIQFSKAEFEQLSDKEKWQNCRWDDVNAMYRTSVLKEIPFREVEFGEDMIWAKDALSLGYKIIYDSRSKVWHYHHYSDKKKLIERISYSLDFTYKTFQVKKVNPYNFKYFIRLFYLFLKFRVSPKWWFYNIRLFFVSRKAYKNFKYKLK